MRTHSKSPANRDPSGRPAAFANSWNMAGFLIFGVLFFFLAFSGFWTWLRPTWTAGYNAVLMNHLILGGASVPLFVLYLFKHLRRTASVRDKNLPIWIVADFAVLYICQIFLEDFGKFPFVLIPAVLFGHVFYCAGRFSVNQFRKKNKVVLIFGFLSVFAFLGCAFFGVVNTFGNIPFPTVYLNFHRWFSVAFLLATAPHLIFFVLGKQDLDPLWKRHLARRGSAAAAAGLAVLLLSYPFASIHISPASEEAAYEKTDRSAPKPLPGTRLVLNSDVYPQTALMTRSKSCGDLAGCHSDALIEWESSSHRYGGNRMVRTLIQRAIDEAGLDVGRFCIGCHIPASAVAGLVTEDYYNQTDPAIYEGSSCAVCHGIVEADPDGNGAMTVVPPFGWLQARSEKPNRRIANHKLIQIKPDYHNRVFRKKNPLLQDARYCAACHEVYLPTGNGKIQLHDVYQSWLQWKETTGKTETCIDCHMPYFEDHVGNPIRSHRFYGGNQALHILTADWKERTAPTDISRFPGVRSNRLYPEAGVEAQARLNEAFLKGDFEALKIWKKNGEPRKAAVMKKGPVLGVTLETPASVSPGSTAQAAVTTRSLKGGHSYPTGSVHTLQTWLHFRVEDAEGREVYVSGALDERGYLDENARGLGNQYADENGEVIRDGRIWRAKEKVFHRVIPPAGEIEDRFAFKIPPGTEGPLKISAVWKYRKASQHLTDAVFGADAGIRLPVTDVASAEAKLELR